MLFNSFGFIFLYLPVVLAGYLVLGRWRPGWTAGWLALASLFFYGYWDSRYVLLLLGSILFNYGAGRKLAALAALAVSAPGGRARRCWLVAALAANLLLLAWFKYANFLLDSVDALAGAHWNGWAVVLPVGISFFTFTQIAFLVDCHRGQVREYRLVHYLLFVSYFPHLIAGPVLHHGDMMPQFSRSAHSRPGAFEFALGLSIFIAGLAKKTLLADPLSALVGPAFAHGAQPPLVEAWIATLAYMFQLYFDFSGYSDMALGLSRLFGIKLPLNFNSPYRATDIADFWRRWHMTLSRFLRDYLYVPLGGNRGGALQSCRNLMLTMLLGGLWHGAGWTFVVWGGLHGIYLVLQRLWRTLAPAAWIRHSRHWSRPLTLLAVMLAWIPFRAPDLTSALNVAGALVGANGIGLPGGWAHVSHGAAAPWLDWLARHNVVLHFDGIRWIDFGGMGMPTLVVAAALALWAPNTQTIFAYYQPCIDRLLPPLRRPRWAWWPGRSWSVAATALLLACLLSMNQVSEFLYFQF